MTDWRSLRASVRGASHRRTGAPNQDVVCSTDFSCMGRRMRIVALADGHGSAKSFRSHHGAGMAVGVATQLCRDLLVPGSGSSIKRQAEEKLARELVRRWRGLVGQELARRPFSREELEALDPAGRDALRKNPSIAYGSTLLTVVVTPTFILYLQLGDGDLLTVTEDGEVQRPFAKDDRLIANETTSLCSNEAWKEVRVLFQVLNGKPPAMILVATDGYANSFRDEESFLQVARDLWEMIRQGQAEEIRANLKDWLNEASTKGSGDDISLGLIFRAVASS